VVVVGRGQVPGVFSPVVVVVVVVVVTTCCRVAVVVMVMGMVRVMIRTRIWFLGPGQTQGYV